MRIAEVQRRADRAAAGTVQAMTVLSRGARARRGGRRPGWPLLTALLVLAIGASSALVFTSRVELLKFAVILALWAAVVAAFASVIYRRQSDADQARARDLKLVYDLQLDREISARREYELTVESQLRRELASELRSQAADEVAALRTELTALRSNLQILFGEDLDHHPALEAERATVRAYSDWGHEAGGSSASQVPSSRVADMQHENVDSRTDQNPIIDVPEVGVVSHEWETPEAESVASDGYGHYRGEYQGGYPAAEERDGAYARQDRGVHPRHGHDESQQWREPYTPQQRPQRAGRPGQAAASEEYREWQPVGAEGQWLPPGAPGSNWASPPPQERQNADALDDTTELHPMDPAEEPVDLTGPGDPAASQDLPAPPAPERRGRHASSSEAAFTGSDGADSSGRRARGHRSAGPEPTGQPTDQEAPAAPPPASAARHRSLDPDADADASASGGQSVADLLARLQAGQTGGGRRRRREE